MMASNVRSLAARIPGWKIAAVIVLAVLIRLLAIQSRGMQYDDVFSIFLSQRSLTDIINGTAADTMPPLYYFLLHFWLLLGQQPGWIRLLSVLLSVLAVFLTFALVRRLYGSPSAEWAAFLMAISPFQYYHAQDVRNYALLLCSQLGYLLAWVVIWQRLEAKEKTSWGAWLGLVVCGSLAMYTHNVAIFGLIIPDVFLLISRRWKQLGRLVAAQVLIAAIALPWLWLVPGQIAKVQRAWWQGLPGLVEIVQIPVVWTSGLPLPGVWLVVGLFIAIESLALIIAGVVRSGRVNQKTVFVITAILVPPSVMFFVSYLVKPIFVPRGFILASAAYYSLAGWVIAQHWRIGLGKMIAAGFIMAALVGLPAQITFQGFPRSPFESAAADVAIKLSPGSLVVHDNKLSYFPFRYYQPQLPQKFVADPAGSGNDTFATASQVAMQIFPETDLQQAVGSSKDIYFIVFTRTIEEYIDMGESGHPSILWLRANFDEKNHWIYNDLEVFQFTKP